MIEEPDSIEAVEHTEAYERSAAAIETLNEFNENLRKYR